MTPAVEYGRGATISPQKSTHAKRYAIAVQITGRPEAYLYDNPGTGLWMVTGYLKSASTYTENQAILLQYLLNSTSQVKKAPTVFQRIPAP